MTIESGTVRYHRANWTPDATHPWRVQFAKHGPMLPFTAAEGEAMGLTPPEPAPLVVTCGAHSIELSNKEAEAVIGQCAALAVGSVFERFARLLRDARQDPQPASDDISAHVHLEDDASTLERGRFRRVDEDDTASDTIDFDALPPDTEPVGTVVSSRNGVLWVRLEDGWNDGTTRRDENLTERDGPWEIVFQPAPLSPGACLRGLLAGRTDADALMKWAREEWQPCTDSGPVWLRLRSVVGDAAREVHDG